jgi:hypothetical protein
MPAVTMPPSELELSDDRSDTGSFSVIAPGNVPINAALQSKRDFLVTGMAAREALEQLRQSGVTPAWSRWVPFHD